MSATVVLSAVGVIGALPAEGARLSEPAETTYTVAPGDTVFAIARRTGVPVKALVAANGLTDPDRILVGQVLRIPVGQVASPAPPATSPAPPATPPTTRGGGGASSPPGQHTVRRGESLWVISRANGVSVQALAAANGLALTARIHPGMVLNLPAATARSAPAVTTTGPTSVPATTVPATTVPATTVPATTVPATTVAPAPPPTTAPARTVPAPVPGQPGAPTAAQRARLPLRLQQTPDRLALWSHFHAAAAASRLPTDLLMAMAWMESGWQRDVRSLSGAIGIGQLMPATASWLATQLLRQPGLDPWDAADNIRMSAAYLRYLVDLNGGDEYRALAAYYQGHWGILRSGVSKNADRYARTILELRSRFS